MRKRITLPNAFAVLIIIMVFVALLTYILPAGGYSIKSEDGTVYTPVEAVEDGISGSPVPGTYEILPSNPQGLFDVINAPVAGLTDAIGISIFILMVGGLIGVVTKTGAIDLGIGSLMMKMKGKERTLITILTFLFSFGGTTYGMSEETIAFYPLLLPIMIRAGYDPLVVMGVVMGGSAIGCMAAIVSPFSVGIASGFAGISLGNGIVGRTSMWFIMTLFVAMYVSRYAKKILADPSKSLLYGLDIKFPFMEEKNDFVDSHQKLTTRQKMVLGLFSTSFVFMTYSVIPFSDLGIAFLPTLGWWFQELSTLFLVVGMLCGLLAGFKHGVTIDAFIDGMREVLSTAIIVGVARGIVIIMNDGLITATVLHLAVGIVEPLGGVLFINALYFLNVVLGFFVTSTSGLATLTMPIFAPLAELIGINKAFVINAYVFGVGLINIITPSSGVVMGACILCKIPYEKWFKFMVPVLAVNILLTVLFLSFCIISGIAI